MHLRRISYQVTGGQLQRAIATSTSNAAPWSIPALGSLGDARARGRHDRDAGVHVLTTRSASRRPCRRTSARSGSTCRSRPRQAPTRQLVYDTRVTLRAARHEVARQPAARRGRRRDGARRLRRRAPLDPLRRARRHRHRRVRPEREGRRRASRRSRPPSPVSTTTSRSSPTTAPTTSTGSTRPSRRAGTTAAAARAHSSRRAARRRRRAPGAATRRRSRLPVAWTYGADVDQQLERARTTGATSATASSTTSRSRRRAPTQTGVTIVATGRKISNTADTRVDRGRRQAVVDHRLPGDRRRRHRLGRRRDVLRAASTRTRTSPGTAAPPTGSNYAVGSVTGSVTWIRRRCARAFDGSGSSTSYTNLFAPPSPLTQAIDFNTFLTSFSRHRERGRGHDRRRHLPRLDATTPGG